MPTLHEHLLTLPQRDLRAIATRLGVRRRGQNRKADWISAVAQAWQETDQRTALLAQLSPAAHAAAYRLAQAGALPAALFFAEFGAIRRAATGRHWQPPPWEAPDSVSEELYYAGLLCPLPQAPLERAARLALVADLQSIFAPQSRPPPLEAADLLAGSEHAAALVHDVAQLLCFLLAQPDLRLLHGRWLAPGPLAAFNRRLLQPDPAPQRRSHKRAPRLRFIAFLAAAAGLVADGQVTPTGWAWLAQPPAPRLAQLWRAWRSAPTVLRQAFDQPEAALPPPWPGLLLDHLGRQRAPFGAADLAATLLGQAANFTTYFAAHLPDLAALDRHVAALLTGALRTWGVVTEADASSPEPCLYMLTETGCWLLTAPPDAAPPVWPGAQASTLAQLTEPAPETWQIAAPISTAPHAQAVLGLYAAYQQLLWSADPPCHRYDLTETTVAAASAAGYELASLLQALTDLGLTLTPEQTDRLMGWHARGRELRLVTWPLLQAATPELMARLHAHAAICAGLGDLLSPTIAPTTLPPAELAARLRAAGFFLQASGVSRPEPETTNQNESVQDRPPGSRRRESDDVGPTQYAVRNTPSTAALWLASQLYATLGEHLALPLPPPFTDLAALLAALPTSDQAIIQTQWERLRSDLQALLDGRTFAPPPVPSDPAQWRPHIEAAIAAGRPLVMRYFTAGRNVLTERTVTPYWIEEHRGIPYLRADCHLAGRVLLFRLDRIQALQETSRQVGE